MCSGGADKFLDNLISVMNRDPSYLLNAIHCLRLDSNIRCVDVCIEVNH